MPEEPLELRVPGMRDLVGDEMARIRSVEDAFAATASAWGFDEVRTPLVEYLHLYTVSGALAPQMLHRVYSFLDWDGWSGERVVLRPDSTVAIARLYAERFAGQTARLSYRQSVLRFAVAGEEREAWQCGAELIGQSGTEVDSQLVVMALEVFQRLGLARPAVVISHPGVVRALLARTGLSPEEQVGIYDRVLAGDTGVEHEIAKALPALASGLKLLLEIEGSGPGYIDNLRAAFVPQVPEIAGALTELTTLSQVLADLGVEHTISSALVRDFEYYTGLVFHLRHDGQLIAGGGRYDRLIGLVSEAQAPACGFALDTTAVADLLAADERSPRSVTVVAEGPEIARGLDLVRSLHEAGLEAAVGTNQRNGPSVTLRRGRYEVNGGESAVSVDSADEAVAQLSRLVKVES
jgi:histidyl-tRNA synthetase